MVYKIFDKKTSGSGVTTLASKPAIKSMRQNKLKNFINPLLENLQKKKSILSI